MRHKNHFPRWVEFVAIAVCCVLVAGCKDQPDAPPPGKMNLRLEPINQFAQFEMERDKAGLRPVDKEWRITRYNASFIVWGYPPTGRVAKHVELGPKGALVESDNFPTGRTFIDDELTSFEVCVVSYFYETKLCQVLVVTDDATVEEWVRGAPTSPGIDVASAHALVEKILKRWKIERLLGKWGEVPPKK